MDASLLATKARIPPRPRRATPRDRLVAALEQGVPHARLTLVSAPAGYGKTTLLTQWARASRCVVAWLSVGAEENTVERFLRALLLAWEAARPGVRESPVGVLLGARAPNRDAVVAAFISAADDVAGSAPEHTAFVIDDYHLIDDPAIHQALAALLDRLPPTFHVVLASRAAPPLPLARYRARDQLLELRAEDLRFEQDETADFLNRAMDLDLAHETVARLHAQLEGWIAGLQLVALTLRRRLTAAETVVVSGRHRFIADYLSEEALAYLPDEIRHFLLRTSILDRLCGPLCDAVAGHEDGQAMLELLERENLFLEPLDDHREWFRYHRLFADFLQEELSRRYPDEIARLHRRAARWHLARDLPEPAFRHAVAGEDVDLVAEIAVRYLNAKLMGGEIRIVQQWIDSLPAAWFASHPILGLLQTGVLAFTGQFDACARRLDDVEQRLESVGRADAREQRARVAVVRCFMACISYDLARAEALADQALRDLPEEDLGFRPGVFAALGDTYRRYGRWEEARASYLKILAFNHSPTVRVQSAHVFGALADLALRQGRLREAAGHWRQAQAAIQAPENWGRLDLPVSGWVDIRMGEVLYEWNDVAGAWERLARGLERADLGGDTRSLIAGYLLAGRIKLTEGDVEAATAYLERARPLVEQAPFPGWTGRFERCQLELWLAQDRLRAAVDWSDAMLREDAFEGRPDDEVARLAMARVSIVKGDGPALAHALALLDRLLQTAEAEGRAGVAIEALALLALAHERRGDRVGALPALERALRLAEPEGYVRLFADLGPPMARLLQEAGARGVMPDYVATLLAAFAGGPSVAAADRALPEPLSPREQEALRLLAAGLTNREIAAALSISPETVKKHTASIYGKLGVGNRTEAAARARELGLLDE